MPDLTLQRTYRDVRMIATTEYDQDPDLSWLDQSDADMGDGFEREAHARKDQYAHGNWHMIGVIVTCYGNDDDEITNASVWNVESDSDEGHIRELANECADECRAYLVSCGVSQDDAAAIPLDDRTAA